MSAIRQSLDIYAAPQTLVSLGERRLNLHVTGEGRPTVVLAAGYLGLTLDWIFVQRAVTRHARVVSFDNAGLGFSDPGPEPRSTSAIVADLRAALAAADIGPPYILVGHSAGGLRMRLFAALHPDEVAGLVMVDTVTTDWEQRLYGVRFNAFPQPHRIAQGVVRAFGLHAETISRLRRGFKPDIPGAAQGVMSGAFIV